MPSAVAHVEALLAERYRHELDRPDKLWQSLAVFAALLALQLTALSLSIGHLAELRQPWSSVAFLLLIWSGLFTLLAVAFILRAVYPSWLHKIPDEATLRRFAVDLDHAYQTKPNVDSDTSRTTGRSPLEVFVDELAAEYAGATTQNRLMNDSRARDRDIAGFATVLSLTCTFGLVALILGNQVPAGWFS